MMGGGSWQDGSGTAIRVESRMSTNWPGSRLEKFWASSASSASASDMRGMAARDSQEGAAPPSYSDGEIFSYGTLPPQFLPRRNASNPVGPLMPNAMHPSDRLDALHPNSLVRRSHAATSAAHAHAATAVATAAAAAATQYGTPPPQAVMRTKRLPDPAPLWDSTLRNVTRPILWRTRASVA